MVDKEKTMITHLLFDFFGTLVEYSDSRTEQGYQDSHAVLLANGSTFGYQEFLDRWEASCHQFDIAADATQDEYSMDTGVAGFLQNTFGSGYPPELVNTFRDVYLGEWSKGVRYLDGVPALLRQLRERFTLVLVTNTHSANFVHSHLRKMQIAEYFSLIVTSVEHGKRKPHPSIFQHALKTIGCESHNALYIGDTFTADYLGANGVGMRCLLIDPHQKQNIRAEDRIVSVLDIQRVLV